jgi:hypothetical protein
VAINGQWAAGGGWHSAGDECHGQWAAGGRCWAVGGGQQAASGGRQAAGSKNGQPKIVTNSKTFDMCIIGRTWQIRFCLQDYKKMRGLKPNNNYPQIATYDETVNCRT